MTTPRRLDGVSPPGERLDAPAHYRSFITSSNPGWVTVT